MPLRVDTLKLISMAARAQAGPIGPVNAGAVALANFTSLRRGLLGVDCDQRDPARRRVGVLFDSLELRRSSRTQCRVVERRVFGFSDEPHDSARGVAMKQRLHASQGIAAGVAVALLLTGLVACNPETTPDPEVENGELIAAEREAIEKVPVVLQRKTFEPALINVTLAGSVVVRMETHGMRRRDPAQKAAHLPVLIGAQYEVPVIGQ